MDTVKKSNLIGNIILIFVAVIWGTAFAFQRVGMDSIEPITFAASRMTLSAVAIGILSLFCSNKEKLDDKEKREYTKNNITGGICCGVFLASASIFQQMGMVYTSAGKAGFITALYMLLVPIINFLIFRKRNNIIVWFAVLLGVFGMYLLCMTESFSLSQGDTLICICAVLFSGHILCCDHFAGRGNPIRISAIQFITTAIISWIAAFITESPSVEKVLSATIPILYCVRWNGLYSSDCRTKAYRAYSCIPAYEFRVCVCSYSRRADFERTNEFKGAFRLCYNVCCYYNSTNAMGQNNRSLHTG